MCHFTLHIDMNEWKTSTTFMIRLKIIYHKFVSLQLFLNPYFLTKIILNKMSRILWPHLDWVIHCLGSVIVTVLRIGLTCAFVHQLRLIRYGVKGFNFRVCSFQLAGTALSTIFFFWGTVFFF